MEWSVSQNWACIINFHLLKTKIMRFKISLGPFHLKPVSLLGLLFSVFLFASPSMGQDSSHANFDSLGYTFYDSVHTFDNMGDLPIDMKADDRIIFNFPSDSSLFKGSNIHETHSVAETKPCTDDYNMSFAANTVWYVSLIYEAVITANLAKAAKGSEVFYRNLKKTHRIWCDCLSSQYGYDSHLCEDE